MLRRLLVAFSAATVLLLVTFAAGRAEGSDQAQQVSVYLTTKGYTVQEVDYWSDEQGRPDPNMIYVLMDAVTGNLDGGEMATQAVSGFYGLHKYYPMVDGLVSVLAYKQYWIFFGTLSEPFDMYLDRKTGAGSFWDDVRRRVRIYDRTKKTFTDEKSFTGQNQTNKDQISKSFGPDVPNPVPAPVPAAPGKTSTLWLEPSTAYLPADQKTNVTLIATLLDSNYAPLVSQEVAFSYEASGKETQELGSLSTDTNGAARAALKGPLQVDGLLLRASSQSLNSQVSITVGPAVTSLSAQKQAVTLGLKKQGYDPVEVDWEAYTAANGDTYNSAYVLVWMKSQTLDRQFYSQMSRMFGTLRTVFPKSDFLVNGIIYRKDARQMELTWGVNAATWDQFVAGKISEAEFWRYLQFYGACVVNGNTCAVIDDKNFWDKDFGGGGGQQAQISQTLESTTTRESWGDQWHGQEFVVLTGGYADTFVLTELTGNATSVQIFQSPEFTKPFLEFKRGDDPAKLKKWRLPQGQYIFAVAAPSAPAVARMSYVEHVLR